MMGQRVGRTFVPTHGHKRPSPIICCVTAVTGCSPDLVRQEPGWAANIPLDVALHLGRLYRQDAIFWISAGQLHLVACTPGATPELLAPWSTRLRTLP